MTKSNKEVTIPEKEVNIPEIKLTRCTIKIVGDSPLICHNWSQKAKLEMLGKYLKKASAGREIRRPSVEFANSLYWLSEKPNFDGLTDEEASALLAEVIPQSKFGFPTTAFKAAALNAGFQQGALVRNAGSGDLAKTTARGAFRTIDDFAVINGTPIPREDMVKIGKGSTDIRYRAEFKSWSTELEIVFNSNVVSLEQIVNLFSIGGFANGVGEWRPEKSGSFGTFHCG